MDRTSSDIETSLPDLSALGLDEILALDAGLDQPGLAAVLSGIRRRAANPAEALAGFQSSI